MTQSLCPLVDVLHVLVAHAAVVRHQLGKIEYIVRTVRYSYCTYNIIFYWFNSFR